MLQSQNISDILVIYKKDFKFKGKIRGQIRSEYFLLESKFCIFEMCPPACQRNRTFFQKAYLMPFAHCGLLHDRCICGHWNTTPQNTLHLLETFFSEGKKPILCTYVSEV